MTYRIRYEYERHFRSDSSPITMITVLPSGKEIRSIGTTACYVERKKVTPERILSDTPWETLSCGIAICQEGDNFCKRIGRNLSFFKAVAPLEETNQALAHRLIGLYYSKGRQLTYEEGK